jgi:hypothetical protein
MNISLVAHTIVNMSDSWTDGTGSHFMQARSLYELVFISAACNFFFISSECGEFVPTNNMYEYMKQPIY